MKEIEKADPCIQKFLKNKLYEQQYRLLDADTKRVYDYHDGKLIDEGYFCYETWGRKTPCENCISKKAVSEKASIIKLEVLDGKVFLASAFPITIMNKELSLELVKNVTNSIVTESDSNITNFLITDLVDKFNAAVMHDSYTGLYNKRYAEEELDKLVRSWTIDSHFSVIMLDIDNFKYINDTHGHLQGDEVIHALADKLKTCINDMKGSACRIGGDEFLLIMDGYTESDAKLLLKKIQVKLARREFGKITKFHVSISGGVAEYTSTMKSWEDIINLADHNMYVEKSIKRNSK